VLVLVLAPVLELERVLELVLGLGLGLGLGPVLTALRHAQNCQAAGAGLTPERGATRVRSSQLAASLWPGLARTSEAALVGRLD
jgi:hypothetical protein